MRTSSALLLLLGLLWNNSHAQFTYRMDQSVPVEISGRQLSMAWAGGINSAQVNMMDLNNDQREDIVLFDRSANRVLTYLSQGSSYVYAPDYESFFPSGISHWMLLRDFNCDGRKDIFTSDPFGMIAFVNITQPGSLPRWRPYNPGFPILTKGFSGNVNLKVNQSDIPAIDDVDNDGDLDILNVKFVGIGNVEFHKNQSMEQTGSCDSLRLERMSQNYYGFTECSCGSFAFNGTSCPSGRVEHAGGKALLTIDMDNDGDRELLFSEESCGRVYLLTNVGTKENPLATTGVAFPSPTPIAHYFPAPFLEDVDHDGQTDLLASPNLYPRTFSPLNYKNSLLYFRNTGTNQAPVFAFAQNNFLQSEMIDLLDFAVPATIDVDGDQDEDLLIGVYGDDILRGSIYLFENIGTVTDPSFRFVTDDFGFVSFAGVYNVKPQIVDMNGDDRLDLAFTSTDFQNGLTTLQYLPNMSETGLQVSLAQVVSVNFQMNFAENVTVADINQDGIPDVLRGTSTGALEYWENAGPKGTFNLSLKSSAYLQLSESTSRQNPASTIADLDADGRADLVLADQRGYISIYGDFRNFDPLLSQPITNLYYNELAGEYETKNLGPRVRPTVSNLFNNDKPSLLVGTEMGGLYIFKNDGGKELPPDPVIDVYPNPLGNNDQLTVRADRNMVIQVYTMLGQQMSEPISVPAHQPYPLQLRQLAVGLYVVRCTTGGRTFGRKFVVR